MHGSELDRNVSKPVTGVAGLIENSPTLARAKDALLWPVRPGTAMATAIVTLLALSLTMTFASTSFGGPRNRRWYTSKLFVWLALLASFTWVPLPSIAARDEHLLLCAGR